MTQRIRDILQQLDNLDPEEVKELFIDILKLPKLNVAFSYHTIQIADNLVYLVIPSQKLKSTNDNSEIDITSKKREPGFLKGEFYMADDFDAPIDDFKEYMY